MQIKVKECIEKDRILRLIAYLCSVASEPPIDAEDTVKLDLLQRLYNEILKMPPVHSTSDRYISVNRLKEDIKGARLIKKPRFFDADAVLYIIDTQPSVNISAEIIGHANGDFL